MATINIKFSRQELSEVMKPVGDDVYGFYSKKEAKSASGKTGYTTMMKEKIEAVLGLNGLSVAEPMRKSGTGADATRRCYWTCHHGRESTHSTLDQTKKEPRIRPECKIVVSCLDSMFHPNQDELVMNVKPSQCIQCLYIKPAKYAKKFKSEMEHNRADGEGPTTSKRACHRDRNNDIDSIKAAVMNGFDIWKDSLLPDEDPFEAIRFLTGSIQTQISRIQPEKLSKPASVFGTSKEMALMNGSEIQKLTVLPVPRNFQVKNLMPHFTFSDTEAEVEPVGTKVDGNTDEAKANDKIEEAGDEQKISEIETEIEGANQRGRKGKAANEKIKTKSLPRRNCRQSF